MALVPFQARAGFTNAGFESNSLNGWTVASWLFNNPLSPYPPTSISGLALSSDSNNRLTYSISSGTDANTGGNVSYPLYGTYAAVVNFNGNSKHASSIYQSATMLSSDVDSTDSKVHIRFAIAPVLENPGHNANEQPFFVVEVIDITKGSTLYFQYNYSGQSGVPWLSASGDYQYTNWQSIDIAPGAGRLDVGDQVSIQILAAGCELGGHAGYVYVDAGNNGTSLPGLSVTAVAGASNAFKNSNFTYTYNYINSTNATVNSVQVAASLPAGTTFVSTTGSSCTTPSVGSSGNVTCSVGNLAAGASGSFAITVLVTSSATSPLSNGDYSISGTGVSQLIGPLVTTPIPDYTLTGPIGGALNTASTAFSVTPNIAYTGTITITPSGGGVTSPVVLTFSNSSTTQTFTVTPTQPGPITLTPSNGGGLVDPSAVYYNTPSAAPTIGSATAGNTSASISFTAPGITGGAAITGYTATCNPGAITATGTSSPISVTGLTNGTAYTCSVTATNPYGTSAASSTTSSFTPYVPATGFSLTGPSGGALNTASSNFTVTPNSIYTGTITITPSGGGLSTPTVLTFATSATPQTFTITPTSVGPVTLTPSNNGSLSNPSALTYATPSSAPTIGTATPGNGQASVTFTAPGSTGGASITGYTATCNPGAITHTGTSSPITVTGLTNGTAYTCSVTATNSAGTSAASSSTNSVTPFVPATTYTFTGPSGNLVGVGSTNFTVTPNATYTGTITITPSGGGLSTPVVLTFSSSSAAQTFTITPTAQGPVTLTPTNNGSLANPSSLTYDTQPAAPTIGTATAGNGSASLTFTPGATGGSPVTGYTATCNPGAITATGSSSPITISGLTNYTAYTCSVTATNTYGTSSSSSVSNSVTPFVPATSFTFTGPAGGVLGAASSTFTVTPNATFFGTITITPSGAGLTTPIVLTFNSSTAQTFTVTPTAAGPLTLTPANSGSLTNPSALTYATTPVAPTIGSGTPGNGSVTVTFSAPASTGGSPLTGYAATCNPGAVMASAAASPILVTGLTNGTAYTCSVTASNAFGSSVASGSTSSVTPLAPGSTYSFTGPGGGTLGTASGIFTVTPSALFTGTITVTPSGGGLSTPVVLSFTSSAAPQTFTVTPTSTGPVTLTPTNSGILSNPSPLNYSTPPAAPVIGSINPGNASASIAFTAPSTGGSAITGYTATCSPGSVTATSAVSPLVVANLTNGTAYTCTVTATNAYGTSPASAASSSVTPVAPASSYTFTGPAGGVLGTASTVFTVTPNAVFTGTITITPSGGGLSTPVVLTFSSATPQTFTLTPTAAGPVTLTPTNSGVLSNPAPLTYATPPAAPTIGTATPGNGSASVTFTPGSTGGSPVTQFAVTCNPGAVTVLGNASPVTVTGLTNGTAYTCSVVARNTYGTSPASAASNSVTPGAPASTYTFTGPAGGTSGTFTVTPNAAFSGTITVTPSGGGLSTPVVLTFNSAAPQTFTVTPSAPGPVTLTPTNNGSLANPPALSFATAPAAPSIGTITPGNGSAAVSFSAGSSGGSPVTAYAVTCNPGPVSATGSASPINVTGLTNGTAYSCSVTASNAYGTSPASATGSATPASSASGYSFTGPAGGGLNLASPIFTVTPNSPFTGTISIAPSGGGVTTPIVLTFNNSLATQTFTVTPTTTGPVTLTPTNSGNLTNPSALTYATPPAAPPSGSVTAGNGSASVSFVTPPTGGAPITIYTATCNPGALSATSAQSPIQVTGLTNGTSYTCSVTASNAYGTSPASFAWPVQPVSPATSYTFTGPAGGVLNGASASFTVTPNAAFTGSITITPSGGGLSSPVVLTFTNSAAPRTFTVTPTAPGPVTLTPSNSGTLTNPSALTYDTPPAAPVPGTVTMGNGTATLNFTPGSTGGSPVTGYTATCNPGAISVTGSASPIVVSGLTNGITYSCSVTAANAFGTSAPAAISNVTPGTVPGIPSNPRATPGDGQATVSFSAPASTGGAPITGYIVTPSGGGAPVQATSSPVTIPGLINGTTYTFTVAAVNQFGTGPAVTSNSITPSGVPGAPVNVSAAAGDGQATISFMPPASNGGSPILGYTAVSSPGGHSWSNISSPITISGLSDGIAYTFTVYATNAAGNGPPSAASNSVTPQSGNGAVLTLAQPTFPIGVTGDDYPLQILLANGGKPPYTFSISGALPPGLTFTSPQLSGVPTASGTYSFLVTATDSAGNFTTAPASIQINPANVDLIISQSTVEFTLMSGAQNVPQPASVTVRSSDIQQLLNYSVAVSPAVPWLSVLGGGSTPGSVTLSLLPAALTYGVSASAYQTTVTVSCMAPSTCAGLTKSVIVSLNVLSPPATPAFNQSLVTFNASTSQPGMLSQQVGLGNSGGGQFAVTGSTLSDSWLSLTGLPTTVAAGSPVTVLVSANTAGLAAGFYTGSVSVATSAGTVTLPVNLRVAAAATMSLAQAGAQFTTTQGNALGNPNGAIVLATASDSPINYSAAIIDGASWITLGSTGGTASSTQPGTVAYTVNPLAAAPTGSQTAYGLIRITSPDVVNSPQDYQVVMNVQPAATPAKPQPLPAGLTFTAAAAAPPAAQPVTVYASSTNPQPYQASAATQDGAAWLSVSPASDAASSATPGASTVTVNAAGLAPGVYTGGVSYAFSSDSVRTVNVTLIVPAAAQGASCVPTRLVATQTGLTHNFQQQSGWPVDLAVQVADDCGTPANGLQVIASFSSGDAPLTLVPVSQTAGLYTATWLPLNVSPQVNVVAGVFRGGSEVTSSQITGEVTANAPPRLDLNSVQRLYAPAVGAPLAPGSLVQISGSNLASASLSNGGEPLPFNLGGTSVWIGGLSAPIFSLDPGLIVAQVPFELTAGNQYPVEANVSGAWSAADSIALVPVAPGIRVEASGDAYAQHTDLSPISDASPAQPGETVIIYLTGMGATDVYVPSGAGSPLNPLAHPLAMPSLTVNGAPVPVLFAGLTPGLVGTYQINFQLPQGLPTGRVQVAASQSGITTNTVTIPVVGN
jgi:hypothetical protein